MASPPMKSFVSFTETWHNRPYPAILPTRPEISASGKSVFVTGGGAGIGKAAAIAFAQAGAKSPGDVTNRTSIEAALGAIEANIGGKIDIFINNAGMLPLEAAVIDYPESEIRRCFEINLMGSFNALQAFTPLAAPGAKLLNAAALKMIDHYASENPNIHVVSIHPGIVGTEIDPNIPVGPDTVELPAHFLVWIASSEAAFLRKKLVRANWDVEELKARAEEIQSSSLLRVSLTGVDM
ncbi:hypothetical protein GE09DRAFT_1174752 [Coniochaeta sp. 2T2.1]|nr:hypothetical protein GE09DRAFT_1174752 [Coniochaeta sp. 2T2.1]